MEYTVLWAAQTGGSGGFVTPGSAWGSNRCGVTGGAFPFWASGALFDFFGLFLGTAFELSKG